MKLQLLLRFVPKLRCDISDFKTLTRPAFQPVKNNFDCWQRIFTVQRFVHQHFDGAGLYGSSARIDLSDLVAHCGEQSLRMRSALRISALAWHKTGTRNATKLSWSFAVVSSCFPCCSQP